MTVTVKVEILHGPGCPHVDVLDQRIREALGDCPVVVTHTVVSDMDTAMTAGMTGSPTLLVGGTDPFARERLEPSISCRLYQHEDGHVEGAPSVEDLRRVLG